MAEEELEQEISALEEEDQGVGTAPPQPHIPDEFTKGDSEPDTGPAEPVEEPGETDTDLEFEKDSGKVVWRQSNLSMIDK